MSHRGKRKRKSSAGKHEQRKEAKSQEFALPSHRRRLQRQQRRERLVAHPSPSSLHYDQGEDGMISGGGEGSFHGADLRTMYDSTSSSAHSTDVGSAPDDLVSSTTTTDTENEDKVNPDAKERSPLSSWHSRNRKNREAAAKLQPLLDNLTLTVMEGCAALPCSSCRALQGTLRCIDCSSTEFFCTNCWIEQHQYTRVLHTPEVHHEFWTPVLYFLQVRQSEDEKISPSRPTIHAISSQNRAKELVWRHEGAGADELPLHGIIPCSVLIECKMPKLTVKEVTVLSFASEHAVSCVKLSHCSCSNHSIIEYMLCQRLWPLSFSDPGTALTFGTMQKLDRLAYGHDPTSINSLVDALLGMEHALASNVKNHLMYSLSVYQRTMHRIKSLQVLNLDVQPAFSHQSTCHGCPICSQRIAESVSLTFVAYDGIHAPREKRSTDASIIEGVDTLTCGIIASPVQAQDLEAKAKLRVQEVKAEIEAFNAKGCGAERNFKAISSLDSKRVSDFDQHGLLSAVCAHGMILCSLMMTQPECFLMSIMLLTMLKENLNNPAIVLLLYDVMCRAAPYLFKHMGDIFITYVAIPIWHAKAHLFECATKFSAQTILEVGQVDGEDSERMHAYVRRFCSSLRRQTAANYYACASQAMLAWNTLKTLRLHSFLNQSRRKLLRKQTKTERAIMQETEYLVESGQLTPLQLDNMYLEYRKTATQAMRAENFKGSQASALRTEVPQEDKEMEQDESRESEEGCDEERTDEGVTVLPRAGSSSIEIPSDRVQWYSTYLVVQNIKRQLSLLMECETSEKEKARELMLNKQLLKQERKLQGRLKKLNKNGSEPSTEEVKLIHTEWTVDQLKLRLPQQILNNRQKWLHALWLSDKPQLRSQSTRKKNRHANQLRTNVVKKKNVLLSSINTFNKLLNSISQTVRPTGVSEIKSASSEEKDSLVRAIDKGLGPLLPLASQSTSPHQVRNLFYLKDTLVRIRMSLIINIEDRQFYIRYLENRVKMMDGIAVTVGINPTDPTSSRERMFSEARRSHLKRQSQAYNVTLSKLKIDLAEATRHGVVTTTGTVSGITSESSLPSSSSSVVSSSFTTITSDIGRLVPSVGPVYL